VKGKTAGINPAARSHFNVSYIRIRRMFVHDENFALLITWTCYGTWLPGDRRGYVSSTRLPDATYDPKQNIPGSPITADHSLTRQHAVEQQKHTTATLDQERALVAAHGIVDACAIRNWQVVRAALMWNHVHVIVKQCPDNGPEVRRILKGVSQNAICKHDGKSRRWWTEKGSDRYLHGERAVLAAAQYVANQPHPLAEIVDMQVIGAASGGVYPR
jgi:REP element-mobilizing transposase RayT